jgi:NAD+ kinase
MKELQKSTFTIVQRPDECSAKLAERIRTALKAQGLRESAAHPDTVFVVGGDGTFLYAVHKYMNQLDTAVFYGIHTGTLGFFTDYRDDEAEEYLNTYLNQSGTIVKSQILEVRAGRSVHYGLNEMRIENTVRTQCMDVLINGTPFETFRGTGMLVATQLGSTAYNRSLGGAVIQEGLPLLEMCEIAGIHHSAYRSLGSPVIVKEDAQITFRADSFAGAVLGVDSDIWPLDGQKEIHVCLCPKRAVRMYRGRGTSWFEKLHSLF